MPDEGEISAILKKMRSYLTDLLLPFWIEKSPDQDYGGFLTHFEARGRPTGETTKT
jgi:mannose/cellobiose epimerase-like protein (N-acyl-D-glucosamine 2-epimerase family)